MASHLLPPLQGGAFFVSASNDETCRIWDTRKLERDVSFRSRLTFNAQAGSPAPSTF